MARVGHLMANLQQQQVLAKAPMEIANIVIRDIEGQAEIRAIEELQKEVWGLPDLDVVPLSHLVAVQAAGGVLVGAFDVEILVGFIYGFLAYEKGQAAHHSHMLAVKPAYRNLDLGRRLKFAQRDRVVAQGINFITWTFDPLQSLNAYFNFKKLGVVADRYLINFYGEDAASFLHRNGTDRLWVTWPLQKSNQIDFDLVLEKPIPLVQVGAASTPARNSLEEALSKEQAFIEIPSNINELQQGNNFLAWEWREATRWAFTSALDAGYTVVDFARHTRDDHQVGRYLLTRVR